jgi:hypothetical protein
MNYLNIVVGYLFPDHLLLIKNDMIEESLKKLLRKAV